MQNPPAINPSHNFKGRTFRVFSQANTNGHQSNQDIVNRVKIIRAWRKTMTMNVLSDGTVVVRAPYLVPKRAIEAFIESHQAWIQKRVSVLSTGPRASRRKYKHGELFLFQGTLLTLTIGNYSEIAVQGENLLFPQVLQFRIQKELETWYLQQSRQLIRKLVESYAARMKVSYVSISFSDTSSKWGSCTQDNKLQFNWRLIMAPMPVIEYLVVHELVHILEKNHSTRFWSKVRALHPSYKIDNRWLKNHGHALTLNQQRPLPYLSI